MLPCLFFLGSALIVYKILLTLGCKQKKALLGLYLFTTSPIAIFSQFVFVQYDSFTVFFVLLGIWLYLKKKPWGFILSLGVAATFKYYALVILCLLYTSQLRLDKLTCTRREFFDAMAAERVNCQVHYIPVYYFPYYQKFGYSKGLCPRAEYLYERIMSIPLFPAMTNKDAEDVVKAVKKIVAYYRK